jgi:hypothetical protein
MDRIKMPTPRIICKDGFTLSVQAGKLLYSNPRQDRGPYSHVEVGYPSGVEETLIPYAEDKDKPQGTVYPYTPIELVQAVIDSHGGVDIQCIVDHEHFFK